MTEFVTLGGRVKCTQCRAKAKGSGKRCLLPAVSGYAVCRVHGARGGPKTEAGRKRCAAAKTTHGNETRAKRAEYKAKMKELYELELVGREIGLICGSKAPGRKPG
jgi:hypothetical protein